jgi:hypothetical protein
MIIKRVAGPSIINFSLHFTPKDVFCKCGVCDEQVIDLNLVIKLEKLRELVRRPVNCNSWYRCAKHNLQVGGKPDSIHRTGGAVDIYVTGMSGIDLARAALQVGFRRIGIADNWIHVDVAENHGQLSTWSYGNVNLNRVREILSKDLAA